MSIDASARCREHTIRVIEMGYMVERVDQCQRIRLLRSRTGRDSGNLFSGHAVVEEKDLDEFEFVRSRLREIDD